MRVIQCSNFFLQDLAKVFYWFFMFFSCFFLLLLFFFSVLEESVVNDLSKDQKCTYKVSHAIIKGEMPPDLANQEPGPIGVKWGTLANRMMRKGSRKFQIQDIICCIILFWAPSWFQINCHPKCTDGAKNLFKMVE